MNPQFPIFIPSKSRHEPTKGMTMRTFREWGTPFRLIVEEDQYDDYAREWGEDCLLILNEDYKRRYDLCDEVGLAKSTGSGPARNFAWDTAQREGHDFFWLIDDNIRAFYRRNLSKRDYLADGTFFRAHEDWVLRYENIALAGPDYLMFSSPQNNLKPFLPNTRIYSCILIRTDIPFRFRGRYNEDEILSLDVLKAGWCTVLFKAFLQEKVATQKIKGGNTKEFYEREGTLLKSQMLVREHPDVARLVFRYGRWHHEVDHKRFLHRNRLKKKEGVVIPDEPNEYGMTLKRREKRPQTKRRKKDA